MATKKAFIDDNKVWKTMYGEVLKYKDITHQHWSNIFHYGLDHGKWGMVNLATEQLTKRFAGKILPGTEYKPPVPKKKVYLTTEDGTEVTNPMQVIYLIDGTNGKFWTINSGLAKNYKVRWFPGTETKMFLSADSRDTWRVMNEPLLSIKNLWSLKLAKKRKGQDMVLTMGDLKYAALAKLGKRH